MHVACPVADLLSSPPLAYSDVTSETSPIIFNIYDRSSDADAFLGTINIKPVLRHDHTVDNWYKCVDPLLFLHPWQMSSYIVSSRLLPHESETVTGEIRIQITYEQFKVGAHLPARRPTVPSLHPCAARCPHDPMLITVYRCHIQTRKTITPRDFQFLKLIGRGTFGRVFQVRKKDTKRIYAMKVLSKKEIVAKKEVAHTIGERKILQKSLESPFLVGLKFSFQTETELYLVTDFKSGGELFWHLQREQRFTEDRARFYIAELILALEHLHKYDIVYRYVQISGPKCRTTLTRTTQRSEAGEHSSRCHWPRRTVRLWIVEAGLAIRPTYEHVLRHN